MVQHREGCVPSFTARYKIFRLVQFEVFADIRNAIAREKEIKGWRREKKIWLTQKQNPRWDDLAAEFFALRQRELEKYADKNTVGFAQLAGERHAQNETTTDPSPTSAKTTRPGSG